MIDLCSRAGEQWRLDTALRDHYQRQCEDLSTVVEAIMAMEYRAALQYKRKENDYIDLSLEAQALQYTGDPEDYQTVEFKRHLDPHRPGDVVATSIAVAQRLAEFGFVRLIGEQEAEAWAKRERRKAGGWMDDPKWKAFVSGYKRLRTALVSRRLCGA